VRSAWYEESTAWIRARDLLSGSEEWVPIELVHTAYVHPPLWHDGAFATSTTGLAASLVEADATVHGILECVERDAIALANLHHGFLQNSRIDPETIDHPGLSELIEWVRARGMLIGLWYAPSRTGFPVAWCQLMEGGEPGPPILPFQADGSAASVDLSAAIGHAIYEAAQTRLTAISGARDDMSLASYPRYPDWARIKSHRRLLVEGPRTLDFRVLAGQQRCPGDLGPVLSWLEQKRVPCVLSVTIDTSPLNALSVVKTLIPALQPLLEP
jgi:ribosomal protein S12 methylthiotransferase accessory factor